MVYLNTSKQPIQIWGHLFTHHFTSGAIVTLIQSTRVALSSFHLQLESRHSQQHTSILHLPNTPFDSPECSHPKLHKKVSNSPPYLLNMQPNLQLPFKQYTKGANRFHLQLTSGRLAPSNHGNIPLINKGGKKKLEINK